MELNGYGYLDFTVMKSEILLPTYETNVTDGEFILNLFNGKKQQFKPMKFYMHAPSEHTIDGKHFDVELQILHHYKGTDHQLGAVISIFFDTKEGGENNNNFLESIFKIIDGPDTDYSSGTIGMLDFL